MREYTTPTQTLRVKGVDLTGMRVYVSYHKPNGDDVTFSDPRVDYDGDDSVISVKFTQAKAALLGVGKVAVQVNAVDRSGNRIATAEGSFRIGRNLMKGVV